MIETVRKTPNGLHITYDDGQNVHVAELRERPWCGGMFYLSCGHDSTERVKPDYCPTCGAKVVSE